MSDLANVFAMADAQILAHNALVCACSEARYALGLKMPRSMTGRLATPATRRERRDDALSLARLLVKDGEPVFALKIEEALKLFEEAFVDEIVGGQR